MLEAYLIRGLKAGLVAGLALGLFVALLANPMIGAAEGLADEHEREGGEHGHGGVVPAAVAEGVSILGGVFWGLLLGTVFGLAFYVLEPALPGTAATGSYVLAAAGFVSVSGAPWLVLPPQPPGVEQVLPTDARLVVYAGMMVAGLTACLLAGAAYGRLRRRGRLPALAAAAVPFCLLGAVALAVPVPAAGQSLPGSFVAAFRAQVMFGQVAVWALLAAIHARLHASAGPERGATRFRGDAPTAD